MASVGRPAEADGACRHIVSVTETEGSLLPGLVLSIVKSVVSAVLHRFEASITSLTSTFDTASVLTNILRKKNSWLGY